MKPVSPYQLKADEVVIARIVKARGIRGEVACDMETDFPERFQTLDAVTVVMPKGVRLNLRLERHWFHQDRVILKFAETDTMTDAEQLVGGLLVIAQADAWQLEDDEFYEYDLMGLQVVTLDGTAVGRVTGLLRTSGNDLLKIENDEQREILIPFVDEICPKVDVPGQRLTINPPEGLLDL
ncbi:MAG: ribosome maturation factor RimM [Acidobacteria bacterium]|nr:ribosome maturation factor RimM [Acidobacteriota bacterium]